MNDDHNTDNHDAEDARHEHLSDIVNATLKNFIQSNEQLCTSCSVSALASLAISNVIVNRAVEGGCDEEDFNDLVSDVVTDILELAYAHSSRTMADIWSRGAGAVLADIKMRDMTH